MGENSKMINLYQIISIITLNISDLKTPIIKKKIPDLLKKKDPTYPMRK